MLTRAGSPRIYKALTRLVLMALLCSVLVGVEGSVSRSVAAQGSDGPFEYRLPGPGEVREGGNNQRGNLGNPGSTDADPDEFSVNNVGIRNPDIQIGVVDDAAHGRLQNQLHATLLRWLRAWLPLFLGR